MTSGTPPGRLDLGIAQRALERSHDPYLIVGSDGEVTWVNQAISLLGFSPDEVIGRPVFEFVYEEDLPRALTAFSAVSTGFELEASATYRLVTPIGGHLECDVAGWMIDGADGGEALVLHVRPTQDARIWRDTLQRLLQGDRAETVIQSMLELIYHRTDWVRCTVEFTDETGQVRFVGSQLPDQLVGHPAQVGSPWLKARRGEAVLHESLDDLPPQLRQAAKNEGLSAVWVQPVVADSATVLGVVTVWVLDGSPTPRLNADSVQALCQATELVVRWRRQIADLEHAADHDPLTGLANRRAVTAMQADDRLHGVAFIDVDLLKEVNDSNGHAAGDQVLCEIAQRLRVLVGPTDVVSRIGGDEFGIVCTGIDAIELETLAEHVAHTLDSPITLADGSKVRVSVSIGLSHGEAPPPRLLEHADSAMYEAKLAGRGTYRWSTQ